MAAPERDDNGFIKINDLAELKLIGNDLQYPLNEKYILMDDITISDDFTPLGLTLAAAFKGEFNGNNKVITFNENARLYKPAGGVSGFGLFGYLEDAKIYDLKIVVDCSLTTFYNPDGTEGIQIGVLAGYSGNSIITKCKIEFINSGSFKTTGTHVGGLIGMVNGGSISECSVLNGSVHGSREVGGLIGYLTGGSVEKSFSTADVSSVGFVGGLIGRASVEKAENFIKISNCYAEGNVTSTGTSSFIGGLIGYVTFTPGLEYASPTLISECYATGNVVGEDATYAGGLLGGVEGVNSNLITKVQKCYATGNVKSKNIAGGLIGNIPKYTDVSDCYSTSSVSASYRVAGGLVGNIITHGNFTNCYAAGRTVSAGDRIAGGLIGTFQTGIPSNSLSIVNLENCYSLVKTVSSPTYSGEIVGRLFAVSEYSTKTEVEQKEAMDYATEIWTDECSFSNIYVFNNMYVSPSDGVDYRFDGKLEDNRIYVSKNDVLNTFPKGAWAGTFSQVIWSSSPSSYGLPVLEFQSEFPDKTHLSDKSSSNGGTGTARVVDTTTSSTAPVTPTTDNTENTNNQPVSTPPSDPVSAYGTDSEPKSNKTPYLIIIGGVVVVGAAAVFLIRKRNA